MKRPDPIHKLFLEMRRTERITGRRRNRMSKRMCREIARREIQEMRS